MAKAAKAVKNEPNQQEDASQADSQKQAQSVEFAEASGGEAVGAGASLDILLDMNVPVTISIGRTEISVRRLLQLGPGSVLKLGKPIDEPVDLYLRDNKFATGSVVVVDGRFAVKITQIFGLGDTVANAAEA